MEMLTTPFNPRPKELDPVEGVSWGNQATLRLVSGPTYQNIELVTDITDPKDIERVMLKLNGKEIINLTGEDLVNLQKHRKQYTQAGRYIIPFADISLRTKAGVRTGELVTLGGEIWMLYIQLKAKDAGTVAPVIRARAHTTAAQATRYYMPRLYSLTWFASATGRTPFDFSERSPFLTLKRIHFKDDSIERIRVLRDDREEMNVSKVDNAYDLALAELEQTAGYFTLDFVRTGFGTEGRLPTNAAKQLQFELEKSAAGSVPLVIEAIEQVATLPAQGAAS
ncbi:major capsid protein P2 [Vibrio astriarenae]|uniref:Major capsid protein P2 n=1 Tax=Vibrio agarivorans TaxID=153622 RepID=A0ABT7XZZ4_9VIBR|nr:major capsid protein P2 [Vibrio agarivorans]MDN2481114.1 major capsid protein P2 [Vibrio agarivorans]